MRGLVSGRQSLRLLYTPRPKVHFIVMGLWRSGRKRFQRGVHMDLIYLAVGIAFFLLSLALVAGCEKLRTPR